MTTIEFQSLLHPSQRIAVLEIVLLGLAAGCGSVEETSPVGDKVQKVVASQGMSLQGMSLQGMSLQGMSLQGMSLQGMSLQGVSLQGISLQGALLTGIDSNGTPVQLRIAQVTQDPKDPEILRYALEAWDDQAQLWANVCSPDPAGEQWAIPTSGTWDSTGTHLQDDTKITWACGSGVIAKCVRWGYKPWKVHQEVSLFAHHQACTRMARADYCGDGTSHTRNGTLIDLYDTLGIQAQTEGIDMPFEAAWTETGAYCISKERWEGLQANDPNDSCSAKLKSLAVRVTDEKPECFLRLQPQKNEERVLLRNRSYVNLLSL